VPPSALGRRIHFLGLAVRIVILLAAGCGVLPGVNRREQVRQAWTAYAEGRPAEAKKRLGGLARDDRATFMLANIALSEGDLTRAAELAAQLQKRQPTTGEVRLLGRLVQRRRESPGEAWFDSYAAAWREAGRPELINVFTPQAWGLLPELKVPDSLRRAALGYAVAITAAIRALHKEGVPQSHLRAIHG